MLSTAVARAREGARPSDRLQARRREQTPQALARLVVIGLFIALWLLLLVIGLPMPTPFLAVLCCEALFFVVYLRVVALLPSARQIERAHYVMLAAEIIFHTTMVYFLGGVAWLGAFAYVFGLIFTNTFLDLKRGLIYTTGAAAAFLALLVLEATGVVPYYTYPRVGLFSYRDGRFVLTTALGGAGVFYSIYLWTNWVGRQLRSERDSAVRSQDALLEARVGLQRANRELEERVSERTRDLAQANDALLANEEILRKTIESTTDGLLALTANSQVHTNALFRQIWGVPDDVLNSRDRPRLRELIGRQIDDADGFLKRLSEMFLSAEEHSETLRFNDGRTIESYSRPLIMDGRVNGRVWSFRDISERVRAEAALRDRADRDALTGTLNHAVITDVVRDLIEREPGHPFAVAMVDIDGMKATNDTYGHQVGDRALAVVAGAMARDGAIIGRYGGDEFIAVLPGAGRPAAERYRESVTRELEGTSVQIGSVNLTVPVVVSMGIAVYPAEAVGVEDLIKLADSAMYQRRREQRRRTAGPASPRPAGDDREAQMVGEIVPLLTLAGTPGDKLRLVAHQLSIGAGYELVNFEVFDADVLGTSNNAASGTHGAPVTPEALEVGAEWLKERRILPEHPGLGPIVRATRAPIILDDVQHDERLTPLERRLAAATGVHSAVLAPMYWHDEMVGVLSVHAGRTHAFSARDAQFLNAVATQVTAIVRMAATSARLERAQAETVLMLAAAAEAHDATTGRHLQRVRTISEAIALELGYTARAAGELALAAVLHDIGKIRVPEALLSSAQRLDTDEWSIMQQHTVWGAEFLRGRPGFDLAAAVAEAHHERWDGSGYPHGLAGEEIPEAATIVAVADCFDAMTNDRPYRIGRPASAAAREVEAWSGTQFNPRVVQAFLRLWQRGALPGDLTPPEEQAAA
ncbi:MAG TPA: HD domain-containing phosphohydrolase [Dehalococcoidia bacterium]|nr:HD domain-containing phosphohydrolase [Dehalococcoidia bacterium]